MSKRKTAQPTVIDVTGIPSVLLVRPMGKQSHFSVPRVPAAQAAEFEWGPPQAKSVTSATDIAILDKDTHEALAVMTCDGFKEAVSRLEEVRIELHVIDGPVEYNCGDRIVAMIAKFATIMIGTVCDEAGQPVEFDELTEIGKRINDLMKARRAAILDARERTILPDGNVRIASALSFVSEKCSPRRKYLGMNYFDVEPASFHDGQIRAYELAKELLAHHKRHSCLAQEARIDRIREAAMSHGPTTWGKKTIGNVADPFLDVLDEGVRFFARNAEWDRWLDAKTMRAMDSRDYFQQAAVREKADMVERLRLGREAKKQKAVAA